MIEIYEEAARLLAGKALKVVSISVSAAQEYRLERLAEANGWEKPEALHIILANGLAFEEAGLIWQSFIQKSKSGEDQESVKKTTQTIAEEWERVAIQADTRYATHKFMTFRLVQNNQTLQFNRSGLKAARGMALTTISYLQKERYQLEKQLQELRDRGKAATLLEDELNTPPPDDPALSSPTAGRHLSEETEKPTSLQFEVLPRLKVLTDGSCQYTLAVIDELYQRANDLGYGLEDTPSQDQSESSISEGKIILSNLLIERGLFILEAESENEDARLPARILDFIRAEGVSRLSSASDQGNNQPSLPHSQETAPVDTTIELKALDHYLTARSSTLVMEGQLARLKLEGQLLEEEVQALRQAENSWQEWNWSTRQYLSTLKQFIVNQTNQPELEDKTRPVPRLSAWQRLRQWLSHAHRHLAA